MQGIFLPYFLTLLHALISDIQYVTICRYDVQLCSLRISFYQREISETVTPHTIREATLRARQHCERKELHNGGAGGWAQRNWQVFLLFCPHLSTSMHGASDVKLPSLSLYSLIISLFLSALPNSRKYDPRHQSDLEMDRNAAKECSCPSVSILGTELLLASFIRDNRPCLCFTWVCVHIGSLFVCEPLHYKASKYSSQTTGAFYRANTIIRESNDTKPGLLSQASMSQCLTHSEVRHPKLFSIYYNLQNSKTIWRSSGCKGYAGKRVVMQKCNLLHLPFLSYLSHVDLDFFFFFCKEFLSGDYFCLYFSKIIQVNILHLAFRPYG